LINDFGVIIYLSVDDMLIISSNINVLMIWKNI
jgi:hypothetical protein